MAGNFKPGESIPRQDLYDMTEELTFDELGLVGEKIAPPLYVNEKASTYPTLPKEAIGKVPDIDRAPDGSFNEEEWDYESKSYTTSEKGFVSPIDETNAIENAHFIDEEQFAATSSKSKLYLGLESKLATALYNETTFAGSAISNPSSALFTAATDSLVTVKDEMDDKQNCKPRDVFDVAYKAIMRKKCPIAKKFFSLVLSDDLIDHMIESDDIVNHTIYTSPLIDKPMEAKLAFLANALGFKEIVPVSSMFDASGYGVDANFAKYWSNEYALMALLSNGGQNNFKERAVARQPIWSRYAGRKAYKTDQWKEPRTAKMYIRQRAYRGIVVQPEYGILFKNMKTTVGTDGI